MGCSLPRREVCGQVEFSGRAGRQAGRQGLGKATYYCIYLVWSGLVWSGRLIWTLRAGRSAF